jgi:hypothetical protein
MVNTEQAATRLHGEWCTSDGSDAADKEPGRNAGTTAPAVQAEGMQRLAVMLAMMVLGSPQVYGCQIQGAQGVSRTIPSLYLDTCPGVTPSGSTEAGSLEMASGTSSRAWLKVIHCYAMQFILSYTCNQEGSMAQSDRVGQPWRAAAAAHQDAAATGMQRIGAVELTVETNITWSHVDGCKDCPQTHGRQKRCGWPGKGSP